MEPETCCGCGLESPAPLPIVAVMSRSGGGWESKPVCHACWTDPAHRKTPIKAHFFFRGQESIALANAGSSSLG